MSTETTDLKLVPARPGGVVYGDLKKKHLKQTQTPLPVKQKSNRLVAVYYSQKPSEFDDSLSFYLFRKNSGFQYPILYFHPENKPLAKEFIERFEVIAKPLPELWFSSKISYSHFVTSKLFYMMLQEVAPESEFYFIFQSDSFLLQQGLESYMELPFDYYGAPWEKGLIKAALWAPSDPKEAVKDPVHYEKMKAVPVGNGGFTLRRRRPCEEVATKYNINLMNYQQEDVFYVLFGQLTGLKLVPVEVARRFSWEDSVAIGHYISELKLGVPLGFHNIMSDMAQLLIDNSMKA